MRKLLLLSLSIYFIHAEELIFVQVVWRHGDRAPLKIYPNDLHTEQNWPNGFGELTEKGKKQQYELGKMIRDRYIRELSFLSSKYNPKEIYIRSTDKNRTLGSAMINVMGMYSNDHESNSSSESQFFPWIPIHTVENDRDYIGSTSAKCPRMDHLIKEIRKSEEYQNVKEKNEEFFSFLSNQTGTKVKFENIDKIYDAHICEVFHNMKQPDWLTANISKKVIDLYNTLRAFEFGYSSKVRSKELIKLRGGSLLKYFIDTMNAKIDCIGRESEKHCKWISARKYQAISGHDSTVASFLATLDAEIEQFPEYTASVVLELWTFNETNAVKVLFRSNMHDKYRLITNTVTGCPADSDICPFQIFVNRSQIYIPQNITEDCDL